MIEAKCSMTGKKDLKVNAVGNFPELVVEFGTLAAAVIKGMELNAAKGPTDEFKEVLRDSKFWDVVINGCGNPAGIEDELHEIAIQHMLKALSGDAEVIGISGSGLEILIRVLDSIVGSSDAPKEKPAEKEEPVEDGKKKPEEMPLDEALSALNASLESIVKRMDDLGL